MYFLAVCDDEKIHLDTISDIIANIFKKHKKELVIDRYRDTEDLLAKYTQNNKIYDLIILDIRMPQENGIDSARAIRNYDEDVGIIFVTSSQDYVFQGYDVKALHYLIKPVQTEQLERIIIEYFDRKEKQRYLSIKNKDKIQKIDHEDIVYLESNNKKIKIMTKNDIVITYGKLSGIIEQLPGDYFIFTHKSYIVNLNHCIDLTTDGFGLKNGAVIPVSRSHGPTVKAAFLKYLNL